jgi:hypothetical protein
VLESDGSIGREARIRRPSGTGIESPVSSALSMNLHDFKLEALRNCGPKKTRLACACVTRGP